MSSRRFSIIVTCRNQRDFIQAAVESALLQNPGVLQDIVVVDDGSTDGSRGLLKAYEKSIQLHVNPTNLGAVEARNQGARLAHGEYLVFLDGDDVLKPWALDVYERIVEEQNVNIILGAATWFSGSLPNDTGEALPQSIKCVAYPRLVDKDRPVGLSASTFVVQRHHFWDAGGWTGGLFQLDLQDISLKLAFSSMVVVLAPTTIFYRVHTRNSILSVPPFLTNLHLILEKERAGQYPGGARYWYVRYAWLGGLTAFWIKRAIRAGFYTGALGICFRGWPMLLAGITRRSVAKLRGLRPIETMGLRLADDSVSHLRARTLRTSTATELIPPSLAKGLND